MTMIRKLDSLWSTLHSCWKTETDVSLLSLQIRAYPSASKHPQIIRSIHRHRLHHIPMLHNTAPLHPVNIHNRHQLILRPFLSRLGCRFTMNPSETSYTQQKSAIASKVKTHYSPSNATLFTSKVVVPTRLCKSCTTGAAPCGRNGLC